MVPIFQTPVTHACDGDFSYSPGCMCAPHAPLSDECSFNVVVVDESLMMMFASECTSIVLRLDRVYKTLKKASSAKAAIKFLRQRSSCFSIGKTNTTRSIFERSPRTHPMKSSAWGDVWNRRKGRSLRTTIRLKASAGSAERQNPTL